MRARDNLFVYTLCLTAMASFATAQVVRRLSPCPGTPQLGGFERTATLSQDPNDSTLINVNMHVCNPHKVTTYHIASFEFYVRQGIQNRFLPTASLCDYQLQPSCRSQIETPRSDNLYCIDRSLTISNTINLDLSNFQTKLYALVKRSGNTVEHEVSLCETNSI